MKTKTLKAHRINLVIDDEFQVALDYYRKLYPFLKDNEIIKAVFSLSIGNSNKLNKLSTLSLLKQIQKKYPKKRISWEDEQKLIDEIES